MKKILSISLLSLFAFVSNGQDVKKNKVETLPTYPKIELRYSDKIDVNSKEIEVGGKKYPCMPSKERAIAYVKSSMANSKDKKVIYYVPSDVVKENEVITVQ